MAEDHPTNQQITLTFLERAGYQVDVVENGSLAVTSFRNRRYDLIIMDVEMPVMSGHHAALTIRSLERSSPGESDHRVPIIGLTAFPLNDCREECIQAGMDDCLWKPFGREELLDAVTKWLAPHGERLACTDVQDSGRLALVRDDLREGKEAAPMDYEKAIEEFEGDRGCVKELMDDFLLKLAGQIRVIGGAIPEGDFEAVRKEAHSIRGCASNMTAYPLAGAAGELEDLAAGGAPDRAVKKAFRRVQEECNRLESHFREIEDRTLVRG